MSYVIPPQVMDQRLAEVRRLWSRLFPFDVPSDTQFLTWFSSHSFLVVVYGLSEASHKFCRFEGAMTAQEVIKYASKVMVSRTKVLKILKQKQKEKLCQTSMTTLNSAGLR